MVRWKKEATFGCALSKNLAATMETYKFLCYTSHGTTWPPHLQFASYAAAGQTSEYCLHFRLHTHSKRLVSVHRNVWMY